MSENFPPHVCRPNVNILTLEEPFGLQRTLFSTRVIFSAVKTRKSPAPEVSLNALFQSFASLRMSADEIVDGLFEVGPGIVGGVSVRRPTTLATVIVVDWCNIRAMGVWRDCGGGNSVSRSGTCDSDDCSASGLRTFVQAIDLFHVGPADDHSAAQGLGGWRPLRENGG